MRYKNEIHERGFEVYKGLQAPLMFKGFKGKFIYIGGAVVMVGFFVSAAIINFVGTIPGVIVLCMIWGGGYVFISHKQKKGLHSKKIKKGIFIVTNKYKLRKLQ